MWDGWGAGVGWVSVGGWSRGWRAEAGIHIESAKAVVQAAKRGRGLPKRKKGAAPAAANSANSPVERMP